jgi:hypothetical protein
MMTREDWSTVCDAVVAELLERADITSPPVDALLVANRLEWPVMWDADQGGRARIQRLAGRPTLFVRPDERPERLQWAIAHEIGEASAWNVCQQLGIAAEELLSRQREELANQIAQRLLIPTEWLLNADDDLFALKQQFPTASHELIAWRWLDATKPTIVTIFDQGSVSRRRCNFAPRAPERRVEEDECAAMARSTGVVARRERPGVDVTAWPVHEPNWQREILRTCVDWEQ